MQNREQYLKAAIIEHVFRTRSTSVIIDDAEQESPWMFNFKYVLFSPLFLEAYAELFLARYADRTSFQVAGLESGSLPLITAIVMHAHHRGRRINGFFIRKSRKKSGEQNRIEGVVTGDPIILVDDLIHSGASTMEMITAVRAEGAKNPAWGSVSDVCAILSFRAPSTYANIREQGVTVSTMFTLDDFTELGVANGVVPHETNKTPRARVLWRWHGGVPRYVPVLPKSDPRVYGDCVYISSDTGAYVALDKTTGKEVWRFALPSWTQSDIQFSSPVSAKGNLIFSGSDGTVYALDLHTGKRAWVSFEADWGGGSLALSEELGIVFVPLSLGLKDRHGTLIAFDAATGSVRWRFVCDAPLQGSVTYDAREQHVIFGSDSGEVIALQGRTGALVWRQTLPILPRGAPGVDTKTDTVVVSGIVKGQKEDDHAALAILGLRDGSIQHIWGEFRFGTYATPLIIDGCAYITSLDGFLYAINIRTGTCVWKRSLHARSFASPITICIGDETHIVVGANNGRLTRFDLQVGKEKGTTYFPERIVNACAYDTDTKVLYVPTQGNELYAVVFEDE